MANLALQRSRCSWIGKGQHSLERFVHDPTGTVAGMMNNKVFLNLDYARNISPGAVIVLKQRSSLMPTHRQSLVSITNDILSSPSNGFLKKIQFRRRVNNKRTWTGVPSYVKEQRAISADVDAFDLDEKEFVVLSPRNKHHQL